MPYENKNGKKPIPTNTISKKPVQRKSPKHVIFLSGAAALAVVILVIVLVTRPATPNSLTATQPGTIAVATNVPASAEDVSTASTTAPAAQSGNLVINIKDVSETATFYPMEVDGVKMEVLAVKAPDGTIRTALNTCQVCYDSGRGYYIQEGNMLVCQNCGNRFKTSDVEKVKGGCNPVPILEEYKTVDDSTITIPAELLKEAKVLFSNWKR